MLLMMLITCIDVVGAKLFKAPLLGALDIVMLAQLITISFAAGMTLYAKRHIQVEIFFDYLPRAIRPVIDSIVLFICLIFFIVVAWRLIVLGNSFQSTGEYSPTAYIPLFPFAYSVAFACIPVCLIFLFEFIKSFSKWRNK